ncbi:A disintegrin and metalloproteinase with thrombospondin motifs 15-like [Lampetra planeri]
MLLLLLMMMPSILLWFASCAAPAGAAKSRTERDVTVPVRVDGHQGPFPTTTITTTTREGDYSNNNNDDGGGGVPMSESASYALRAFGQSFRLDMVRDHSFISPAFTVAHVGAPQRGGGGGADELARAVRESGANLSHCFFAGRVNGDASATVALSACGGLRGAFRHGRHQYFIRPETPGEEEESRGAAAATAGAGDGDDDDGRLGGLNSSSADSARRRHVITRRGVSQMFADSDGEDDGDDVQRCGVNSTAFVGPSREFLERLGRSGNEATGAAAGGGGDGGVFRNPWTAARSKRFVSLPRYVETLVVADEAMASYHGADLKHYLLTLMAIAARLYRHPSIRNAVHLVVVKLLVISNEEKGPKISSHAALTLRNFCAWQKKFNKGSDKHPEYYDTAILFTKQDICGAQTCDTLGMADVGTMCDPKRSCSVIEDDGLPSAFTTAHELGHVFNMPHDNVKACERVAGKQGEHHMMSPTITHVDRAQPWSACSAAIITDFLDNKHGDCLLDEPTNALTPPGELPGVSYPAERQCELAFGRGSRLCPYAEACAKLWCTGRVSGQLVCQTRHFPWADGTACASGRWCMRGQCTEKGEGKRGKAPVDGSWGRWAPYGECSRTCGGGVHLARRECDSPSPAHAGAYCTGPRVKYRSCGLALCPSGPDTKSFREEQCATFDGQRVHSNGLSPGVRWLPKYSGISAKDRCKLVCRANGTGYYFVLAPKVVDGTRCGPDTSDVCVQGRCVRAGCDGRLGSRARLDVCGVCGGDASTCRRVSGTFTKAQYGYNYVVAVPAGATNLDVRQRGYQSLKNDDNYLAVRSGRDGRYLLNGHYVISTSEREVALGPGGGHGGPAGTTAGTGSVLSYSGTATASERLHAPGALTEPLVVEVLAVGRMTPPRVRYSFHVPRGSAAASAVARSNALLGDAGGEGGDSVADEGKREKEERKREQEEELAKSKRDDGARSGAGGAAVPSKRKAGGVGATWATGEWGACSRTCGGGGSQRRHVRCPRPTGACAGARPEATRACGETSCPAWHAGGWSPCSKTCGRGFRRRSLRCEARGAGVAPNVLMPRERCDRAGKPQELDICVARAC